MENNSYFLPELLSVSPAPHIRRLDTTRSIMLDVIFALLPATAWGVYIYKWRALLIVLISIVASVAAEAAYEAVMHKTVTVADLSAVVTGLILGLSMPPGVSLWVPVMGAVFAIVVVKQIFGGIGKNIVNPAIAARVFLMLCWPEEMVKYIDPKSDLVSSATPLTVIKNGVAPSESIFNCVAGNISGAIGEVSAIALTVGFVYLLLRRVVSWQIPLGFIGVVAIASFAFPAAGDNASSMLYELFCGSLLLSAMFAANDYSTVPVTSSGKLIFGVGCGIITVIIRYFGANPDGTAYAIMIMNLLVPLTEKYTAPVYFGKTGGKGALHE